MRAEVICGDAREVLRGLQPASVDAVVTDPPYALCERKGSGAGFRGQAWDTGDCAHDPAFWHQVLQACKPGAFLVAFGGTRTYHRLACAIEGAGFQIRDMLHWVYAQGYPKHKNLKPAHEPIVLTKAPGPLRALNIDACKVHAAAGRWPPNVLLGCWCQTPAHEQPGCPVRLLDEQAGPRRSGHMRAGARRQNRGGYSGAMPATTRLQTYGDSGPASRYFPTFAAEPEDDIVPWLYCSKASTAEREAGLDDVTPTRGSYRPHDPDENSLRTRLHGSRPRRNPHSCVKPIALMQWLVQLITPAGGLVLDPFAGTASTGAACVREDRAFIGIELDAGYVETARQRIAYEQQRHNGPLFARHVGEHDDVG